MTGRSFRKIGSVIFSAFALFFLFTLTTSAQAPTGEGLFNANCKQCHSTGDNKVVGPGLKGVADRAPNEAWIIKWVKNSSALIKSGDEYANKVFNDNGKVPMPAQSLKEEEIKSILAYVKAEGEKAPAVAAANTSATGTKAAEDNGHWMLIMVVLVLAILAVVLNRVHKGLLMLFWLKKVGPFLSLLKENKQQKTGFAEIKN